TMEEAQAILKRRIEHQDRHGFSMWAVIERATAQVIGSCGLKYLDDGPDIEVGYHLLPSIWNRGYATEPAGACLEYGWDWLGLARIVGVVDPANYASQRVLEKIGMRYERMGWYYQKELKVYGASRPSGTSVG